MMFCPKCGTELNEDMTCPKCGTQVHTDEKSSSHQKRVIRKLSEDEVKVGYPNDKSEESADELKEDVIEDTEISELDDMFAEAADDNDDMLTDISNHLEDMDAETGTEKDMLDKDVVFDDNAPVESDAYDETHHSKYDYARNQRKGRSGSKPGKRKSSKYSRRAVYDKFADDDYDGTIDDTSAQEMYQRENKNRKKPKAFLV